MKSSEIPIELTSLDYQHARQERLKYRRLVSESVAALVAVGCALVVTVEGVNRAADNLLAGLRLTQQATVTTAKTGKTLFDSLLPDWKQPLQKGQLFLGYRVTSGFGKRVPPCQGCSDFHRGVDLGTPVGVPLFPPVAAGNKATVKCWTDTKGGGLVAEVTSPDFPGLEFKALHLRHCSSGEYGQGQIFARTGSSGLGTGPHLDVRQIRNGQYESPAKGIVFYLLRGNAPSGGFSRGQWQEDLRDGS